jgi:hypothetical protein
MPMQCQLYNPVGSNQGLRVLVLASCSARSALACCRRAGSGGEGAGRAGGGILSARHFEQKFSLPAPLKNQTAPPRNKYIYFTTVSPPPPKKKKLGALIYFMYGDHLSKSRNQQPPRGFCPGLRVATFTSHRHEDMEAMPLSLLLSLLSLLLLLHGDASMRACKNPTSSVATTECNANYTTLQPRPAWLPLVFHSSASRSARTSCLLQADEVGCLLLLLCREADLAGAGGAGGGSLTAHCCSKINI